MNIYQKQIKEAQETGKLPIIPGQTAYFVGVYFEKTKKGPIGLFKTQEIKVSSVGVDENNVLINGYHLGSAVFLNKKDCDAEVAARNKRKITHLKGEKE